MCQVFTFEITSLIMTMVGGEGLRERGYIFERMSTFDSLGGDKLHR